MNETNGAGRRRNLIVRVADLQVSNDPTARLVTYSLGSCVGVTAYDPEAGVGGMLHAMLPDYEQDEAKARENPAMFVTSGVAALFRAAYALGALKGRMIVKVAGGAELLVPDQFFAIGRRNFEVLQETLRRNGVKIVSSAVGGSVSRTLRMDIATGRVTLQAGSDEPIDF